MTFILTIYFVLCIIVSRDNHLPNGRDHYARALGFNTCCSCCCRYLLSSRLFLGLRNGIVSELPTLPQIPPAWIPLLAIVLGSLVLFLGAATVSLGPICQQLSTACLIYHDNPCLTHPVKHLTMQIIELEFKGVQISFHLGNSDLSLSIASFPVCKGREKRSWFTVFAYAHFPQQLWILCHI